MNNERGLKNIRILIEPLPALPVDMLQEASDRNKVKKPHAAAIIRVYSDVASLYENAVISDRLSLV